MKKHWKKLKSRIAHKNPRYQVREDDVVRPDGSRGKYYVVDGMNSVAVVAEDSNGKIYLVGQTRYPIGNLYSWEIITGGLKKGANPLVKAKQELQEEAGLKAKKWTDLGYYYPCNGHSFQKCQIYLAEDLKNTETNFEVTEDITVKKESLKRIIRLIKENKITGGLTIAAIYKYLIHKNQ